MSNKKLRRRQRKYEFDIIFFSLLACYVFLLSPPFSLHIFIYFYYVIFLSISPLRCLFFVAHIKSDTDLENVFIEGKLYPYIIKHKKGGRKLKSILIHEENGRKKARRRKTEGKIFFSSESETLFREFTHSVNSSPKKGGRKAWDDFFRALIPWTWKHEIVQKSFRFTSKTENST